MFRLLFKYNYTFNSNAYMIQPFDTRECGGIKWLRITKCYIMRYNVLCEWLSYKFWEVSLPCFETMNFVLMKLASFLIETAHNFILFRPKAANDSNEDECHPLKINILTTTRRLLARNFNESLETRLSYLFCKMNDEFFFSNLYSGLCGIFNFCKYLTFSFS